MRSFLCLLSLITIFYTSQVCSKSWVDQAKAPDLAHMTEMQKANYWLDQRGEVWFAIYPDNVFDLKPLLNHISIQHVEAGKVLAYANRHEFEVFLKAGFAYEVLTPEWLTGEVQMSDYADYLAGKRAPADWYTYPTYQAYVDILKKFESDYPAICKMYTLGPSGVASKNHYIYALRISDNVTKCEPEPRYLETNTIHGDEVLNMMNCLHMMDTILSSYGKVDRFTKLVDSLEMWFIPNMNPDGTYPSGDNTVQNAQRANLADNFDLNRNNPCPCAQGTHKQYGLYTKYSMETQALMKLQSWYKFPFAQDQHGGTETYLWPYGGIDSRPKDEDWYKWFTKYLVDQIHKDCNNNGYMTSCGGDGIGNIRWELYECHGIRADMNDWVGNGKSITLESSVVKKLPAADLEKHWKWCKEALLMSMETMYKTGLHGIVTDSVTGAPLLKVEVTRNGDTLTTNVNGMILTDSCGRYLKYMTKGTYTLKFKKAGYVTKLIPGFAVTDYTTRTNLNVKLWPENPNAIDNNNLQTDKNFVRIASYKNGIRISSSNLSKNAQAGIYNVSGKLVKMLPSTLVWDGIDSNGKMVGNGCYVVKIANNNQRISQSFILNR